MASRQNNFKDERNICRFFGSANGCWYGDTCRFEHAMPYDMYSSWYKGREQFPMIRGPQQGFIPGPHAPPAYYNGAIEEEHWIAELRPCRFFNTPAGCRHGDRCKFLHENLQQQNGVRRRRNDHNNNHNNNNTPKSRPIKVNEIKCGECGKVSKSGEGQTAKQNLKDHYMDKLSACDDKHIKYFLAEADFHLRDMQCFACGRKFEEVQDLLHHFFRQVKNKSKKRFKHQEQLARIAKPFVDRDWNNAVEHKVPEGSPNDEVKDSFTMQLLKCMVRQKELQGQGKEEGSMMRCLARLARTSESSGGAGGAGHKNAVNGDVASDDDDELDPELEDELEERAQNYGFTQDELNELLSYGIKPWDDDDVDPWDFLEQLHAERASSDSNRASPENVVVVNGKAGAVPPAK